MTQTTCTLTHPNQDEHRPLTLYVRWKGGESYWNGDWAVKPDTADQIGRLVAVGTAPDGSHQVIADMDVHVAERTAITGTQRRRTRFMFWSDMARNVDGDGPLVGASVTWPQGPAFFTDHGEGIIDKLSL